MDEITCPIGDPPCGEPIPPSAPVGICAQHMMQAYQHIKTLIAELDATPGLQSMTSLVYYVRDDDKIKIGVSRNLWQRMNQLPGRLLAIEPGDEHVERLRHGEFAALRIGHSEWFWDDHAGALRQHINSLRSQHGDPLARRYQDGRQRPLWRLITGT